MARGQLSLARSQAGFSVIELLVASFLLSMMLLTIASIFTTFLIGSARSNARRVIQTEGTRIENTLTFLLRNARNIDETAVSCSEAGSSNSAIIFYGIDGGRTTLRMEGSTQISSDSAWPTSAGGWTADIPSILSSDTVTISNLEFTCRKNTVGQKMIDVSFLVQRASGQGGEIKSETFDPVQFATWVEIRNE